MVWKKAKATSSVTALDRRRPPFLRECGVWSSGNGLRHGAGDERADVEILPVALADRFEIGLADRNGKSDRSKFEKVVKVNSYMAQDYEPIKTAADPAQYCTFVTEVCINIVRYFERCTVRFLERFGHNTADLIDLSQDFVSTSFHSPPKRDNIVGAFILSRICLHQNFGFPVNVWMRSTSDRYVTEVHERVLLWLRKFLKHTVGSIL